MSDRRLISEFRTRVSTPIASAVLAAVAGLLLQPVISTAADQPAPARTKGYSELRNPYFGQTHQHRVGRSTKPSTTSVSGQRMHSATRVARK